MGRLHILSITLLFVLDVLFAQEKLPAPRVSVDYFSARIIRLVITVPSVRDPPVSKFIIRYKAQGSNEDPMTAEAPVEWRNYVDDRLLPRTYVTLENLAVKTNYIITVTAVNDVGESAPYEFTQTTKPYSVPLPVVITSPFPDSTSPKSFLLKWEKPDDGGSVIQKYMLSYREVEILPNRTLYELSKPLSGFINVDDIPPSAVRYQLSSLIPGTYYQVELQAINTQGSSSPTSYIFKTKEEGTVIATSGIRITGKDEQEETKNGYLKCEVTQPTVGTNYNLKWYDPNGQYVRFQGETNYSQRLFASRDSNTNYISLNFMPVREFDAGVYTCTATINGQLRNETFKITTFRDITFSNCPLEQKIISGETQQTVLCSASAGGIDLTTYWKRQDQTFQIQAGGNKYAITSAGLIIFNVSKADEKVYEFNAKYDKTFAWEYRSITVKVLIKPEIVYHPTISTTKVGDQFSMLCRANGDPAPKYDWYKEGTANQWSLLRTFDRFVIDEVHGKLKIDPVRKDDEGQYRCQASNEAGSAEAQARLDVQVPPDIIEIRNATGEENGGAVITCKASGDPAPEMKWKPIDSDTFYPEGQSEDISVTLTKDQINRESTMQLKFTNLKPSHMGDYTCQAHNNAGDDIGYGHLSVRYAGKFNNQPTGPFYNWYGNEQGNVTCVVNGNPLPVVQWFKGGNHIAGQALYSIKTIEEKDKFQVTSILSARMDLSNEQTILGDYTCQGLNAAGVNNITIRMVRAEKPPAPGVSVDQFSVRIIRLGIIVPRVRGPPVSKFNIRYKVQGSNENPMTIESPVEWINYVLLDDHPLPRTYVTLYDLAVKTNYIITVTAVNDVGESAPFEFTQTTRSYSVPNPVVITSPFPDSLSPTSFLLMWEKPDDGGSEIEKYILNYREVEIIPNRTQYELSKPLSGFINVDDIPPSAVRYQLSSLTPGTYYQVELQAVNTHGSSTSRSYIFKTKEGEEGTIYPSSDTEGTSVRLVEVKGNPVGSGILEVRFNGQWGSVCDDAFDDRDADVFCRMLGFNKSSHFTSRHSYIPTTSELRVYPIWMDELDCMGNESDVAECNFDGFGRHDCGHSEDVMLFCSIDGTTTTESNSRQTSLDISTPNRWYATHWWYYISSVITSTTTPWYPTTSSNFLDNAITTTCTSSSWYIQVDMDRLRQMYPNARESDIYLGTNSCTGYSNGNTLVFQHGIRDCLTSETVTQNSIVHRNRLVYAMRDPQYQFIIRDYNWTFEVECDDLRNETASSHITHNTIGPLDSRHVQGTSHYNVAMRFYSDPNFQYEIPGNPLYVKVGTDVYVKVYTDTADWGIKMIVRSCYTKPDPYASDSLKYYIIRDGCEADVNTHYISQSTHETKFMFRDFEYTSNHEGLYLYCDATYCETSNYSYQCQQTCDPRGKREAESRPRLTETVQEKIIHTRK